MERINKKLAIVLVVILLGSILLVGCKNKVKEAKLGFRDLLNGYIGKEIAVSMWDSQKSKPVVSNYAVMEVKVDYLLIKKQDVKTATLAIPFHNITNIVLTETPPVMVLNDQILLTGLGDIVDSVSYLGSKLDRLNKPKAE